MVELVYILIIFLGVAINSEMPRKYMVFQNSPVSKTAFEVFSLIRFHSDIILNEINIIYYIIK